MVLHFKNKNLLGTENNGHLVIDDGFMLDDSILSNILSHVKDNLRNKEYRTDDNRIIEIRSLHNITCENPLLDDIDLLFAAVKLINNGNMSSSMFSDLIALGEDKNLSIILIEASHEYGPEHVINTIFADRDYSSLLGEEINENIV